LKKKTKQFTHAQQVREAEFYPKTSKSHRHNRSKTTTIKPQKLRT